MVPISRDNEWQYAKSEFGRQCRNLWRKFKLKTITLVKNTQTEAKNQVEPKRTQPKFKLRKGEVIISRAYMVYVVVRIYEGYKSKI